MQQRVSEEMKVGAFIVAGVAVLVAFLFAIGDITTYFRPTAHLWVVFDSANGIGRGSPVQYAGVEVGKIEEIGFMHTDGSAIPKVKLLARLWGDVEVRTDDVASISTFGLLGEKYLEIMPGAGQGTVLQKGELLFGRPPVSTELVIQRSNEVLTEFKRTLEGLNDLVGDPEARIYLKEALREARDATRNWKVVGERLNVALSYTESGQGSIGKLVYDEELYNRVVAFVEDLRQHPWKLLVRPRSQKPVRPPGPPNAPAGAGGSSLDWRAGEDRSQPSE